MAEHLHAFEYRLVACLPIAQQIVQHRIKILLGRVPWLQQIVVDPGVVDRLNRGIRVRISGQQHPPRFRENVNSFRDEFHAAHFRHALIHQK